MALSYTVTANRLNLRKEPGLDAPIVAILRRGTALDVIEQAETWWKVRKDESTQGFVSRNYLAPVSGPTPPMLAINDVLWERTVQAKGKVAYLLGARHSDTGKVDCSGWVAEITAAAFDKINDAAKPERVFGQSDYRAIQTHSDGIICGVFAATGFILQGEDVTIERLRPGMLIGCNFGKYDWELSSPPRVYGIDHIVQVVKDPGTDATTGTAGVMFITQSSSGKGVNIVKLDEWLQARVQHGMTKKDDPRLFAVDPFRMADQNSAYVLKL